MPVDLIVHLNTLPGGHLVATPVHLPGYASSGDSEKAVLADVAKRVGDANLGMQWRRTILLPVRSSLAEVVASIRIDKKTEERVPVRLSVVLLEPAGEDGAVVAVAPTVNGKRVAGRTREDALRRLAARCGKILSGWEPDDALAAELTGEVAIRRVKVNLKEEAKAASSGSDKTREFLAGIGQELTGQATATSLDERGDLVERVLATLALPERSSVMLVGPPEVGKTALIREVAVRIREKRAPEPLLGREVWNLNANELIAGAQYTGMWQDRAQRLVRAARQRPMVIAAGDPVAILDAGRWSRSDNNVGRMLRPHVESGALTLICEATPAQLEAARKLEPSFVEAFWRVDVADPGPEVTHRIASSAARRLEAAHSVEIEPEALTTAVDLTRRFEPYRGFPGKAVRLIEETVAEGDQRVGREEVIRRFTTRTGLPRALLSDREPLPPERVEEHFGARVLGQPEAVRAMVDLVMVLKAGLNAPDKPLGVYLFVGPTGVGKTELAKALAELLFGSRDRVLRFDMGEHATGDALPRLLGSAWQRDDEGELTRRVREQPFCVVLLDEIEKAHHLVFDALLAAIGEGRLTDAAGRTADFRNAIVIMTSNLGARGQDAPLGFSATDGDGRDRRVRYYDEQVEQFFRPEFVNRLDRVIVFNPLEQEVVRRIVRRELGRLLMREGIVRRQLLVEVDDRAVEQLARRAFHPRYGARPLQREIERLVIQPLARRIVEGRCRPGDVVRVRAPGTELVVDLQRVTTPEPPLAAPSPAAPRSTGGLARALVAAEALRRRLEADAATPFVRAAREELSAEVERTQDPTFWDDPAQAAVTLSRVYELQRTLDELGALSDRTEGLLELGQQMRLTGDRARLGELRKALEEVESRRAMARLELAGLSSAAGHPETVLRVAPVTGGGDGGDGESWARRLLDMYAGWAQRSGRTATTGPDGASLTVDGASTFDLLARERGLHRWLPKEKPGPPCLARVTIAGLEDEGSEVVRIYDEARDRVRDPRTGAEARRLPRVLAGDIDEFLIANITPR